MATKGKRYDKDFKLGAAKMVLEKGRSVNSVAVDLGVSYGTLQRWVREFKTDPQNSFRGSGHLRPEEEELRRLRLENQVLREENAILKSFAPASSVLLPAGACDMK